MTKTEKNPRSASRSILPAVSKNNCLFIMQNILLQNFTKFICHFLSFSAPRHKTETRMSTLLKAENCPRDMPVQHFVNPGQLVQAVVCTQNTQSPCNLDLWPMTLMFHVLLEVVEVDVRAEFHQARCSGSWVVVLTEKNLTTMLKTILPSLTRAIINASA